MSILWIILSSISLMNSYISNHHPILLFKKSYLYHWYIIDWYSIWDTRYKMPRCGGGGNPKDTRYRKWCSIARSIAGVANTIRTNISPTDRSRWYTYPHVDLINVQCLALHFRMASISISALSSYNKLMILRIAYLIDHVPHEARNESMIIKPIWPWDVSWTLPSFVVDQLPS
jgi:hypothetical protein